MTIKPQLNDRVRPVRLRTSGATAHPLADGAILVRSDEPLGPYPQVLTDRLAHWAKISPNKICIAKREADGEWRKLTYAQVLRAVNAIGQALLDRGLSEDRPVAILSENDLEHFLLMLAGQHVGIPTAHISPVYSLVSRDFGKLRHTLGLLRHAQRRHQHPPHALLQPANDRPSFLLPPGRASCPPRLAPLESHLRRESQYRHRSLQRRQLLYR